MRNKATANKKHLVSSLEGFFLQKLEETLANDMNELKGISEDLKNRLGDLIDRQDALTQDHGGSNAKPSDIITFDIDGQEMFARRDTLTAVEDSRLAALFSGRWENHLMRDDRGRVIMDVDAYVFEKILEYLYMVKISDDIPPIPSEHEDEQGVFDAYVDFFALRVPKDDSSEGDTDTKQYNDLNLNSSSCFTKDQKALFTIMTRKLDEMEQKLEADESFVARFTNNASDVNICIAEDSTCSSFYDHSSHSSDDILQPFEHVSVDPKQPSDTNLGIISLYVNGHIIKSKLSTLCIDPTSKLAQDLTNDEWLQGHKIKTDDDKVYYLIEQPAYAFKELVKYLRLKSIIDDDNSEAMPMPNFGDATQEEYFVRMTRYFFSETSDIYVAIDNHLLSHSSTCKVADINFNRNPRPAPTPAPKLVHSPLSASPVAKPSAHPLRPRQRLPQR